MPNAKFLFYILTTYERTGWICKELAEFIAYAPYVYADVGCQVGFAHNFSPAASARNTICKRWKDSSVEWIVMCDNDMAPGMDILKCVDGAPEDAGIVVPAFHLWNQTNVELTMCWGPKDSGRFQDGKAAQFPPGFYELYKCGTGFIFIRPWVFDKIDYPYFRYAYNEDAGMTHTEDIVFCEEVQRKGIKIYGNSAYRVGHYHTVQLATLEDFGKKMLDIHLAALKESDSMAVSPAEQG